MKNDKILGRGLKDLLFENTVDEIQEGERIIEVPLVDITPNPFSASSNIRP